MVLESKNRNFNHDLESTLDQTCIFGLIFEWVVAICDFCWVPGSIPGLTFGLSF